MRKRNPDPIEHWDKLLGHINLTWMNRKKHPYPFAMETFMLKRLRMLCKTYDVPSVMACWDLYMDRMGYWGIRQGFNLEGFFKDFAFLIDQPEFKKKAGAYREKIEPADMSVIGLAENLAKGAEM